MTRKPVVRSKGRFRPLHLALSISLGTTVLLCVVAAEPPVNSNFSRFDASELRAPRTITVDGRPIDESIFGASRPRPSHGAANGDRLLLCGQVDGAAIAFERAAENGKDAYASFLASNLALERGRVRGAREIYASLPPEVRSYRSVFLLGRLLDAAEEDANADLESLYVRALGRCLADPRFAGLPRADHLHQLVRDRLYGAMPTDSEHGPRGLGIELSRLARVVDDECGTRELLDALDTPLLLPDRLLVLGRLFRDSEPRVHDRVLEELEVLSRSEPDNGFFEFLIAAASCPELFAPPQFDPEFSSAPVQNLTIPREVVRRLLESTERTRFDSHDLEIHRRVTGLRRAEGWMFALGRVEPPSRWSFLGDPAMLHRLVLRLTDGTVRRQDIPGLATAAARLLARWRDFHLDPLAGALSELSSLTACLERLSAQQGIDLEDDLLAIPRSGFENSTAWRAIQPYLSAPLPLPSLVEGFALRYLQDPTAVLDEIVQHEIR